MYEVSSFPIKILIVDDDALYKDALVDFLRETPDFSVIGEASDGASAVSKALELNPELVLMDLGLPIMSGVEAIAQIKEAKPHIKIIALTVHDNKEEAMASLEAGATAYVNKDITMPYLKMIIDTVGRGAVWISPLIGKEVLENSIKGYRSAHG